jgi:hypothetical protein
VDRRAPVWAGFVLSLAVSVKITPLVVLLILLVAAWRLGRRDLLRFVLGGVPVFVALWVPPLLFATKGFLSHVMAYSGSGFPRQWGLYQLLFAAGAPEWLLWLYARPGVYGILLLCALVPAWFIRRRPSDAPAAVALSLSAFVLISPAWATQYLAWIAGPVLLLAFWPAVVFTVGAGTVYVVLYIWWLGDVRPLTSAQVVVLFFAWLALVPVVVTGIRDFLRRERGPEQPVRSPGEDPAADH